jgi:hypothetical protein
MELSDLNKQITELRSQIAVEPDAALRREMKKTFSHYQRQLRKITTYRKPWYGLRTIVVFLVGVFLLMVYSCIRFAKTFGLDNTLSAVRWSAVALVLITAMAFVVLKIISPETYTQLVQICLPNLNKMEAGKGENNTKNLPPAQAAPKIPPQLPSSSTTPAAPKVSFDDPSLTAINAGEDHAPAKDE